MISTSPSFPCRPSGLDCPSSSKIPSCLAAPLGMTTWTDHHFYHQNDSSEWFTRQIFPGAGPVGKHIKDTYLWLEWSRECEIRLRLPCRGLFLDRCWRECLWWRRGHLRKLCNDVSLRYSVVWLSVTLMSMFDEKGSWIMQSLSRLKVF